MTKLETIIAEWDELQASAPISKWRFQNPGEMGKVLSYREGTGNRPSVITHVGKGLVYNTDLLLLERPAPLPPPPPPPPPPGGLDAPRQPYTFNVKDATGLGLNITNRQDLHDGVIDGTGDTGILFQNNAGGSTLRRVRMTRVAYRNAVSWGKHAIYAKDPDLLLEDISASCSSYCASVYSLRFDGIVLRDFHGDGASHLITYYETSSKRGQVLVENGEGSFTGDCFWWADAETDYQSQVYQDFLIRNVNVTGSSGAAFLKIKSGRMLGEVRVENCTLNGKKVTSAHIFGAPNLTVI